MSQSARERRVLGKVIGRGGVDTWRRVVRGIRRERGWRPLHGLRRHLETAFVAPLSHVGKVLGADRGRHPPPGHGRHGDEEHDEEHQQQQRITAPDARACGHGFFARQVAASGEGLGPVLGHILKVNVIWRGPPPV